MSWEPLLPAWLILAVLLALGGLTAWAYRRPAWPLLPRLLGLTVLALLLLEPVRPQPDSQREPARLVLALDCSQSMAARDGDAAGDPRFAVAAAALERAGRAADIHYRTEWVGVAGAVSAGRPSATLAGGDGATSYDGLATLAQGGRPPAAIILASDGCDRGTVAPDRALAEAGVPVFCLGVGSARPSSNAAVRLEAASASAFPGQEIGLSAVITVSPDLVGHQARLVIESLADDGAATSLCERAVDLAAESTVETTAAVGDSAGERLYRARLTPLPGEITDADDVGYAAVRVVDRRLRVLVLEGQPFWDTSFALRALRRDRQIAAVTLEKIGTRLLRGGEEPPAAIDAAAFAKADAVVLGAEVERLLEPPALTALRDYVAGGGGLVLLGVGERPESIAALDPVLHRRAAEEQVAPVLAPAGARLALIPADTSALAHISVGAAEGLRPLADLLVGDEHRPAVAAMRHGAGRVIAVNAQGMWRWGLEGQGEVAERFWRQLVKAVARSGDEPIRPDRPRYRAGTQAAIALAAGDAPLGVRRADGAESSVAAHDGIAYVPLPEPGLYRLTRGEAKATLIVDADVREIADAARRDERLARLAAATGGEAADVARAEELGAKLARRADLQVEAPRPQRLVTLAWWMPVLALCLGCEWWLRRKRYGIV